MFLLRCAVWWQVRRMIGARGRRFDDAAQVDGSGDHCGGGSEGPRMRPDSRASRAAMERVELLMFTSSMLPSEATEATCRERGACAAAG